MLTKSIAVSAIIFALSVGFLFARERTRVEGKAHTPAVVEDDIAVYFSPKGGCEEAIVEQLRAATKSIDLQAYSFTNTTIAKAIAEAQERGVKVRAILDRKASGEHYSGATYLFDHHIPTFLDGDHPIAHNKVIILDGSTVITGSFNFTRQAENSNAENLLVIHDHPKIAEAYEKNFELHLEHSKKYEDVKSGAAKEYPSGKAK